MWPASQLNHERSATAFSGMTADSWTRSGASRPHTLGCDMGITSSGLAWPTPKTTESPLTLLPPPLWQELGSFEPWTLLCLALWSHPRALCPHLPGGPQSRHSLGITLVAHRKHWVMKCKVSFAEALEAGDCERDPLAAGWPQGPVPAGGWEQVAAVWNPLTHPPAKTQLSLSGMVARFLPLKLSPSLPARKRFHMEKEALAVSAWV